jgi:hypothetical protein
MNKILLNGGTPVAKQGLQRISKHDLCIDTYQRDPVPEHVLHIATRWNAKMAGALDVSYRNDKFWILDGRQRWEAAKLLDDEIVLYLLCLVYFMTRDEEIDFYRERNSRKGRRNLTMVDLYRADLEGNDGIAVLSAKIMKEEGLTFDPKRNGGLEIRCVHALKRLYKDPAHGEWVTRFIGEAARADGAPAPEVKVYLVDALAQLYAVKCIRDNSQSIAKYFGRVVGLNKASAQLKAIDKKDRAKTLALDILEFHRHRTNRVIDELDVLKSLRKRASPK